MDANLLVVKTTKQTITNPFAALSAVTEETAIQATPEGLHIRASDPSHFTMLDIVFESKEFEIFECPSPITFGVRTSELAKALKQLGKKPEDPITISITDGSTIKLESGDRFFEFHLIEAKSTLDQALPKIPFVGSVVMSTSYLKEVLEAIAVVSKETLQVEAVADNKTVKIKGYDQVYGEFSETIRDQPEGLPPTKVEVKESCLSTFSQEFISSMVAAVKEEMVTIQFGNQVPILLQFGRINYFAAPRVQD